MMDRMRKAASCTNLYSSKQPALETPRLLKVPSALRHPFRRSANTLSKTVSDPVMSSTTLFAP